MRQSFHKACYQTTWAEWHELASWLEDHKEKRLAQTIIQALERQKKAREYRIKEWGGETIWGKDCWGICFRDGSIAKIEKAALEVAFQTAEVVLERVT